MNLGCMACILLTQPANCGLFSVDHRKRAQKNAWIQLLRSIYTPFGNWLPYPLGVRPCSFASQPFNCFAFVVCVLEHLCSGALTN